MSDGLGALGIRIASHARLSRRLRISVPGLLRNPGMAEHLERTLRDLAGVIDVHADVRSGRALIRYEAGTTLAAPGWPSHPPAQAPARWRSRALSTRAATPRAAWHALSVPDVLACLQAPSGGLDAHEAARRLRLFGANAIEPEAPRSRLVMLGAQFANLPSAILLGSAALSALTGDALDAAAILTVVTLNAAIGYTIERKNAALLSGWRRLEAGQAQVVRGGAMQTVLATELVPGDLLFLRAGDLVPADARVVEADRLSADESSLTGESAPQGKSSEPVDPSSVLAERASMLHSGTTIASGYGRALVVATGSSTEVGSVRALVEQAVTPETPLTRRLARLANRVTYLSLGAAAATALAGLVHRRPAATVLRSAVALGVAAIPEGLPVVSTTALVRSMQRMRDQGMLIRRLSSAETLGGVTVICADKTGTLTENDMRLVALDLVDRRLDPKTIRARPDALFGDEATLTLAAAALNSEVDVRRAGAKLQTFGSSTERALVLAASAAGLDLDALAARYPRRRLEERTQQAQYVVSVHESPEGSLAFVKGAPEQVIALCERFEGGPLGERERALILERNEVLANEGLRVLAVAWRRLPDGDEADLARGYTFLGLLGLHDPLRPMAAETVAAARRAGIRTVIVTGDQLRTAVAIARMVGLEGEAIDGPEARARLESDGAEVRAMLRRVSVVARVTPADKVAFVKALRETGEIVCMAGDGTNDAAALKVADVGVAIGLGASDLARGVADVVLTHEDLRTILSAVAEGRIVQDNLRRSLRFLFATNLSEIALVLGAAALGLPEPLTPLQLLWINLLTDTLPALGLALEPGDPGVLDRPPARPDDPILPVEVQRRIVRDGLLMAAAGAAGSVAGRGVGFGALVGAQLAYTGFCRASGVPMQGSFLGLWGSALVLQLGAIELGSLRRIFGLGRTSPLELVAVGGALFTPWFIRRALGGEVVVRRLVDGRSVFAGGEA